MRCERFRVAYIAATLAIGLVGCSCGVDTGDLTQQPGEPLADLTEAELGRFLLGKAVFERLTTPEEGLGPLFNETRCSACHDVPASGGSGPALVLKATRFENGVCDLLTDQGGDNVQRRVTPALIAHGITREALPDGATDSTVVTGPPLFGLGLIEAVPAADLIALEDPDDADGNGVSGRVGRTADGRPGRFGRKAEIATILDFVDTALRFELGLTTSLNPREESINGSSIPPGVDPMPEPEIDERGLGVLTDFIRFLAPPTSSVVAASARDSINRGERVFERIGCDACHTPSHRTGVSPVAALSRKTIRPYSDFLLHDMGTALGDVCGLNAMPSEYRTAALWGLKLRRDFLHDGRATTPGDAIMFHDGEAAAARDAFVTLPPAEQAMLLRFLESL